MDSIIGVLPGIWRQLLRENNYHVSPAHAGKALFVTALSLRNAFYFKTENRLFSAKTENIKIQKSPVFILGHWRSGTTYLHNLMGHDKLFAYPRRFEVRNPHTFLYIGQKFEKMIQAQKAQKRPMDNITNNLLSPAEDEFALAAMMPYSPLQGWAFPRNQDHYEQFSDFRNVDADIINKWKAGYKQFIKKLTFKYDRQLLLKSPLNTGRIKILLEIFPGAKFIHIHRNPYLVFQSTRKLYRTAIASSTLQKNDIEDRLTEKIIGRYTRMYAEYVRQSQLIPKENLCEISFKELENNPLSVISTIYKTLELKGFSKFEPILQNTINASGSYKKNSYPEMEQSLKNQIYQSEQNYFDLWGYSQ